MCCVSRDVWGDALSTWSTVHGSPRWCFVHLGVWCRESQVIFLQYVCVCQERERGGGGADHEIYKDVCVCVCVWVGVSVGASVCPKTMSCTQQAPKNKYLWGFTWNDCIQELCHETLTKKHEFMHEEIWLLSDYVKFDNSFFRNLSTYNVYAII